jgi:plasmid stabilization system protein ParE
VNARFVLTEQAHQDLEHIARYIQSESGPAAAEYVVEKLSESFAFLVEQPVAGHVREDLTRDPQARFWPVFSYLVVYAYDARPLVIAGILHGARDPAEIQRHLRSQRHERGLLD